VAPSPLTEPLHQLAERWRAASGSSRRGAAVAVVGLVWVLALLVARQGTGRARLAAGLAIVLGALVALAWRILERRRLRDPRRILRGLAWAIDPQRAERALRALSLLGPDGDVRSEGTSAELARLHVTRSFAQLPSDLVAERAARWAARIRIGALAVAVCVLGVAFANAWSVLEGADVLAARRGTAPVAMRWLDQIEIVLRPPEYLHDNEQRLLAMMSLSAPYGTLVTVRGVPLHPGRRLLLSDGTTEVPFVDDGAGQEVARWPLSATSTLHVVARFGDVVVPEPDGLPLESIPDQAPVVTVEGAPRRLVLLDQTEDIPIRYEATDDHGLREVELVLRSGTREERRVLARLDGETKTDKGGQLLKPRDPFLRKSHAPVEVTVEAKDNDPLTGPKWGASPAVTIIPPDVGEPEARRLDGLRKLRDALVDTLAWRLSHDPPGEAAARKAFVDEETTRTSADEVLARATMAQTYGGVRVASRLAAMLTAQIQKTRAAVTAEARAPSVATHSGVVKATEKLVLVVDAVIRGLGFHDSRESAKQLADVADDLAMGASRMQGDDGDARLRGAARMDAAALVLAGGGRVLGRLGPLGRDIGEIVDADLSRVRRARDGLDMVHSELAARDLAARLREPDPSFGSRGRTGRGGGESGGGHGTPGEDGEDSGDAVDQAQAEAEQDLERLTQDHAGEIGKMEEALAGATNDQEQQQQREEGKKHAEAVREAVRQLPPIGRGSDSWTSKGSAAKELAEQMARSLEQGRADEATQSGRSSLGALDEAKKMLQRNAWLEDPDGDEMKKVDDARRKLEAEEKWAEQQLAQQRRAAAERARKQLQEGGDEEGKLAERARELGQRSRDKGSMPDQAVESVEDAERAARQAADALKQGDADKGLDRQREAQRALERAQQQLQGDDQGDEGDQDSPSSRDGDGRHASHQPVAIPNSHKGPEDFRRRVVRGLGQPASGSLKDAVHRYAEGLLR
jgi:hypothetical protein